VAQFEQTSQTFPARLSALADMRMLVAQMAQRAGLSEKEAYDLMLAADEAATNIIEHSMPHTDVVCACTTDLARHSVLVELRYSSGDSFHPSPPTAVEIGERIRQRERGGLGLYLMHKLVDSIDYLHEGGRNVIRLLKRHG
jgi:serine/threonine-protein kinase RsbW